MNKQVLQIANGNSIHNRIIHSHREEPSVAGDTNEEGMMVEKEALAAEVSHTPAGQFIAIFIEWRVITPTSAMLLNGGSIIRMEVKEMKTGHRETT